MAIRVRIPAVLRRYSGGAEEALVEGGTVAQALDSLFAVHPDLRMRVLDDAGALHAYLILFRSGERIGLDTAVREGDVVEIIGAAEGG